MACIFFSNRERHHRPFILDEQMSWVLGINHFLRDISIIDGKTSSYNTRRAYAYHLLDWLNYCERVSRDWKYITEIDLASYRNALYTTPSPHTKQLLSRETINGRLGTICMCYGFMLKKGYISQLPFSYKAIRVHKNSAYDDPGHIRTSTNSGKANTLMLKTYDRELEIPPNDDVGLFIRNFLNWTYRLMAETMWLTGMRRSETCSMSIHLLPEDPFSIKGPYWKKKIKGKGDKWRTIKFPVRLMRSISRYVELYRNPLLKRHGVKSMSVWIGKTGRQIKPASVNKAFVANAKKCKLIIKPHDLRHSYATNRLVFLEKNKEPSPLKIVQGELGHSHLSTTARYLHLTQTMHANDIATYDEFIDGLLTHLNGRQNGEE